MSSKIRPPEEGGDEDGYDADEDEEAADVAAPAPAPLPTYQRRYSGERYPPPDQQDSLHNRNYRYQPRDPIVREQMGPEQGQGKAKGRDKDRDKDDDRGKGPKK